MTISWPAVRGTVSEYLCCLASCRRVSGSTMVQSPPLIEYSAFCRIEASSVAVQVAVPPCARNSVMRGTALSTRNHSPSSEFDNALAVTFDGESEAVTRS